MRKRFALHPYRGITLTELLIGIAIIVVLMAIVIPTFATVRQTAYTARCAANFRQIGVAIHQYTLDHSGTYPGPLYEGQTSVFRAEQRGVLGNFIGPYIGIRSASESGMFTADPLRCPAWLEVVKRESGVESNYRTLKIFSLHGSYGYVKALGAIGASGRADDPPMKTAAVTKYPTSQLWLMAEYDRDWFSTSTHPMVAKPLHRGGRHILYFDLHVSWVPGESPSEF